MSELFKKKECFRVDFRSSDKLFIQAEKDFAQAKITLDLECSLDRSSKMILAQAKKNKLFLLLFSFFIY